MIRKLFFAAVATLLLTATACDDVNNEVVPGFMVRINLGNQMLWTTYGVSGVGEYVIFNRAKQLPSNFAYNANTYTGFGGVLLIKGLDISTSSYEPLAFDLACPVERNAEITVTIDPDNFDAVCPTCHSRYNVLTGNGGPISGVATTRKVGLTVYRVTPTQNGGYVITSY